MIRNLPRFMGYIFNKMARAIRPMTSELYELKYITSISR